MNALVFAAIAAVFGGLLEVFRRIGSPYVDQIFGAVIISLVGVIIGGAALIRKMIEHKQLYTGTKGLVFLTLAGAMVFFIDYFALKAYAKGLSVSVGGPIIIGGSMAVAALVGLLLGESVTAIKIISLFLLILGAVLLGYYG